MVSQTDKKNIEKLKLLRQHKMNKAIVGIKRNKTEFNKLKKGKKKLEQELKNHQSKRIIKHDELFKNLQNQGLSSIEDLKQHQASNQQLINDEGNIAKSIDLADKKIRHKREDIKQNELVIKKLNKKIESLKVLTLAYNISSNP
jgi:ASC-1-like (ASCH) protein